MSTNVAPPAKGAPKGGGFKGKLARNKKPLLILGAAVVVVLALYARKQKAGDTAAAGSGVSGDGIYAAGATSTPSGYVAGSGTYDSSITDVYNAMQKQIEQFMGAIPVSDPYAEPVETDTVKPAPNSLGVWAHYRDDGSGGAYYELFDDFTSRIISSGEAVVRGLSAQGRLNDAQFAAYGTPAGSK